MDDHHGYCIDTTAPAARIARAASGAILDLEVLRNLATAKAIAEDTVAAYRDAALLELVESDQGSNWWGGRIIDADGGVVGHFDDVDAQCDPYDLPDPREREYVVDRNGQRDTRFDSFVCDATGQGSAVIDVRAALSINLTTVLS